jgi:chitodextrinase
VSGVSGPVVSAKLKLSSATGSIDGPTVHSTSNDWAEGAINWSNRPAANATAIDDRGFIGDNVPVEYNVKPAVNDNGTFSFALRPASSDGLDFVSREWGEIARRPQLELLVLGADHEAPSAPTGVEAEAVDARRVDLSWTPATDNRGVTNYEIYRDGSLLATTGNVSSYSDTTVAPQTSYSYTVKALDAAVNRSDASSAAEVTTPPAPLTTLTFTPVADTRVQDDSPTANFGSSTKLQAGGGVPKRESYLRFNLAGITGPVVEAKLRMQSTTDGTKNGPALHGAGGGWNETELAWSSRPSHDPAAAHDYGAIPKGTVATYDAESLVNGNGLVNMALISDFNDSVDFGSREHADVNSRPQLIVTFDSSVTDTQVPTAPGTLTAEAVSHTRVDLAWGAASDDVGVVGYQISRDGAPIATVGNVSGYTDTTVSPVTHYDYSVKAIDAAGNRSVASNTAGVDTPAPPASTTATFNVTADARVEEGDPSANFGTSSKLRATNAPAKQETYLKFNLTGMTGTIESAKLHVYASNDASNNGPAVFLAGNSWTETGITWANRPAQIGGPSDNKVAIPKDTWVEYEVTPLVAGNGDLTLVLAADSTDGVNLASKEYWEPDKFAKLVVTYGG